MLTLLLACSGKQDAIPPVGTCEAKSIVLTGVYDQTSDVCVLDADLATVCSELWPWWLEPGCPTFPTYVRQARPRGYAYAGTYPWGAPMMQRFTVTRCAGPDARYDVVLNVDARAGDAVHETEAVFDQTGVLRWVRLGDYYSQLALNVCCEPGDHGTNAQGWGTPVRYDCTDGTPYTPADFPDSADTGATSPTTGDTGAADTADTSDTGTCR